LTPGCLKQQNIPSLSVSVMINFARSTLKYSKIPFLWFFLTLQDEPGVYKQLSTFRNVCYKEQGNLVNPVVTSGWPIKKRITTEPFIGGKWGPYGTENRAKGKQLWGGIKEMISFDERVEERQREAENYCRVRSLVWEQNVS